MELIQGISENICSIRHKRSIITKMKKTWWNDTESTMNAVKYLVSLWHKKNNIIDQLT